MKSGDYPGSVSRVLIRAKPGLWSDHDLRQHIRNCRGVTPLRYSLPSHERNIYKPRMADITIDATTPQLKTVKGAIDGYCSLDLKNALPFLAKDFAFQTFPKISGLPDEPKGEHLERYAGIFALFSKVEVRFGRQGTCFAFASWCLSPTPTSPLLTK